MMRSRAWGAATSPVATARWTSSTPGIPRRFACMTASSNGLLARSEISPVSVGCTRSPRRYQREPTSVSIAGAPLAPSSAVSPGNSSSMIWRPRSSRPCRCRPWGTPRRGSAVTRTSRSKTVTRSKLSASTRAASSPAIPAPRTTAWARSPPVAAVAAAGAGRARDRSSTSVPRPWPGCRTVPPCAITPPWPSCARRRYMGALASTLLSFFCAVSRLSDAPIDLFVAAITGRNAIRPGGSS